MPSQSDRTSLYCPTEQARFRRTPGNQGNDKLGPPHLRLGARASDRGQANVVQKMVTLHDYLNSFVNKAPG